MIRIEPGCKGLDIYYRQHKPLAESVGIPFNYDDFLSWAINQQTFDIYKDNLIGCLVMEPYKSGYMMHIAIDPSLKGRWMFHWARVKKWLFNMSDNIYTGSHITDSYLNRLLPRSGFELVGSYQDQWYRWRLCQQQQR